jgi:antibiotic biosynthesis monooxygenase (ABM) superfamily enzyme
MPGVWFRSRSRFRSRFRIKHLFVRRSIMQSRWHIEIRLAIQERLTTKLWLLSRERRVWLVRMHRIYMVSQSSEVANLKIAAFNSAGNRAPMARAGWHRA